MWIAFSPDGIHWSNYEDNPVVNIHSDTSHYVVRDPRTNRYMAYGRFGFARTVALVESDDFIHWSRPEQILEPDEHEPAGPFPATQFYGMTVDLYEGMYVGGLWIYREGTDGKIDTELASSRDGIHWNRVGDRQTFLPVSPEGTWGDGMVRPAANYIRRGEEIWIYFGMVDGPHSGPKFPGKSIVRKHPTGIGLGKLRRDGFVSLSAGTEPGALLTKPLWIDGPELHLNVEVEPGGKVEVGVCDLWSSLDPLTMDGAYPGLDHSVSMTQGSTNGVVHWPAADLRLQVGNKYRLKIRLESARIYSFWFE